MIEDLAPNLQIPSPLFLALPGIALVMNCDSVRAPEPRGGREHLTESWEVRPGRRGGNPPQLGSTTWTNVVLQALMLGLKGELSFRQRKSVFQAKGQDKHRHRHGR